MVQFPSLAPLRVTGYYASRVAPFGHLRVKARSAARRSFSQLYHVLHRLLTPRHPPEALCSLTIRSRASPASAYRTIPRPGLAPRELASLRS